MMFDTIETTNTYTYEDVLSASKIAYIVGLIDGEGCLDLFRIRKERGEDVTNYIYPRLIISNKNRECLEECYEFLGYGKIHYNKKQDIYTYTLNNQETKDFIFKYGHLLIVKRAEYNILKRYYRNPSIAPHLFREMRQLKRGFKEEQLH